MGENPDNVYSGRNKSFIFIGEYLSSSEIHIQKNPTFFDALQLSRQPIFIQEQNNYQYLNLKLNKMIRFHYLDGNVKKTGKIRLKKQQLQFLMEQPLSSFFSSLLIQDGKKLSFLTFGPSDKIKNHKKDTSMYESEEKDYE